MNRKLLLLGLLFVNSIYPVIAQDGNSRYVEGELGIYRSEASYSMKEQSYPEGQVTLNGKAAVDFLPPIIIASFTKERIRELRPYDMWVTLHFDGIEERLAYVSFIFKHKEKTVSAFLTDAEMAKIEEECKKLKFTYWFWSKDKISLFTGISYYIRFKDFKIKKGKMVYTNYYYDD